MSDDQERIQILEDQVEQLAIQIHRLAEQVAELSALMRQILEKLPDNDDDDFIRGAKARLLNR
jgi:hypothetical protein